MISPNAKLRVLLIEDDEDDRLLLEDTLDDIATTEYALTWIDNATEGAAALLRREHDVCLIDYRLGADTGLDVLTVAAEALGEVPCILLTGNDNAETDRMAMEAGASDYLIKGEFTVESLERAIRYAVANADANRKVRDSEQRFRSIFEAADDGIVLFDEYGDIELANPAAHRMFGHLDTQLVGRNFREFLAEAEVDPVSARFTQFPEDNDFSINNLETIGRRKGGSTFPLEVSVAAFTERGRRHWSALLRDTSVTTELLDQLAHQTLHDRLTGLANRTLLRERVSRAIQMLEYAGSAPAVMIVDIDDFKHINDLHGHDIGDLLLSAVADRMQGAVRAGETLARLASDEFAVLVEERADAHAVIRLAERLRVLIQEPFVIEHRTISLTCSVGISLVDDRSVTADDVIRNADVAKYAAKANGKDRVEVFDERMYGNLLDIIALDQDLRLAIDEGGQLTAHFQPIVDLESRRVHSFEALARWHHPERGWVRPDVFIAAAERSGTIDAVGLIVLENALDLLASIDDPTIAVAVNVSSHQLRSAGFVTTVLAMLRERRLPGTRLILEVTESVIVDDVDEAITRLEQLRSMGIQIALDDFGTGYSSLSYLRALPIDELKLDQSFIAGSDSKRIRALIDAVGTIADSFAIPCVAEGIEREDQRRLLLEMGYTYGQGYLFARPMPADEVADHLDRSSHHA